MRHAPSVAHEASGCAMCVWLCDFKKRHCTYGLAWRMGSGCCRGRTVEALHLRLGIRMRLEDGERKL
jgi:hypothetical protein